MRNKAKNFPIGNRFDGDKARAKAQYASTRADGSINTHPQERMQASSHRNTEE
ncbi:MAG: small, acid-soluble spore protein K [Bacillus sp. (in: firmicutes)]